MSILNDVRLNIGDDDGTAASGTFGSSSFVSVSGSANLLGDIRVNIGDDSETGGGGQLAGSHYLLSSTHLDTVPGTPTSPSVIVSLSGTNLWAILPGTTDGTVLSYTSGSIQFIPIAGVSGVQGPAGPAGPSGAPGPSGETGPQGPAGPSGAQGIQGIQGPSGVAGPSGATGAQGPQGDVGPSGATGPSGLPGQDGATGPQGPPGPIVGWSGVLSVNNWSGPYSPVVQNKLYGLDDIHIASGNQLIWAVNASGNEVVGVLASGSGFIKITDGRDGVGHIIFNSRIPSVWDPLPYDITQALDWLAIATGIPGPSGATGPQGPQGPSGVAGPSGATGADGATGATGPQGPPGPIVGWSGVLNVNNWSGPHDVIIEQPARLFDDLIIASGQPILWSNTSNPSGGFQVGILPSGSGVIKITDGYSGQGYIFYSPSVPTNWSAPAPTTIESALDALVKATGILAGGTGNPPVITEGLAETTSAGNWSSITDVVTLGRAVVSGNILLPSSGLFVWSSNVDPSGTPKVLIYSPGAGLVQVSGHIVYVPSTPGDWNTGVPSTITQALDFLAAATGQGGGSQPQTLNQVLSRGNWSGPIPIVSEHAIYSQSGVFVASGIQIKWSNILSPSGGPQLGIVSSGSGMLKITDGNVGNGHLLFFSRNPGLWGSLPSDVTSALDMLAANSGDIVGLTNISGLSEVLTRGNWGGTTPIVTEASLHISGSPIVSSGQQILWSNRAIPSGGYQLGIMASGSGILKVTDGWSGYGKIYYSPGNVNDWSAPSPVTIESALDALVKATGILAGGTGNPPRIIDGLSETLIAGNWGGLTSFVLESNTHVSGNNIVGSGSSILWTNRAQPSGGYQLGLAASGSGILRISDGWSGDGYIFYSPTTPGDWDTGIPATIERALDLLAAATGQGGGGGPSTDGLSEVVSRGNWSGPQKVVFQSGIASLNEIGISSGLQIKWGAGASGNFLVGLDIYDATSLKITDAAGGLGSLVVAPNSLYIGNKATSSGIKLSAPQNNLLEITSSNGSTCNVSVPGFGSLTEVFGYLANAQGTNSMAIGRIAVATASRSIAIGESSLATNSNSIAFGNNANAGGSNSVILGADSSTTQSDAVVIGFAATGVGVRGIGIGSLSIVSGLRSIAIGTRATNIATNSIAIGAFAYVDNEALNSIAIGFEAVAVTSPGDTGQIAIGYQASGLANKGIAIGYLATTKINSDNSIAIGNTTSAEGVNNTIVGSTCRSIGNNCIVIGNDSAFSDGGTNIAIGRGAVGGFGNTCDNNIAIGSFAVATSGSGSDKNIAIGVFARNLGANTLSTIAIGEMAHNNADNSIAIGGFSQTSGALNSIALGYESVSLAQRNISIGYRATSKGYNGITIGPESSTATTSDGAAIGAFAIASGNNTVAIGSGAFVGSMNSTSIGLSARASGANSVVIGSNSRCGSHGHILIGPDNISPPQTSTSIIIGSGVILRNSANQGTAILIGHRASGVATGFLGLSQAADIIAIGRNAFASSLNSSSTNDSAIAIGNNASANVSSIAIGAGANALASYGLIAIGKNARIDSGEVNCLIGYDSRISDSGNGCIVIGTNSYSLGSRNIVLGYESVATQSDAIAIGYNSRATHTDAVAFGRFANTIANNTFTFGSDAVGANLHAPNGYMRIGHLHSNTTLASGDIWAGGHNQPWLWYNQDSGTLRIADSQGRGIIELNAVQQRATCSGDIVYTGTRIAGMDVFTTSATVRREFSIFRHGASVWPVASLPSAPESGVVHTIKDGAGLAATNNIMVSGVGKTIDGQNGIPIVNNYGSLTVVYNGTEWSVT